MNNNVATDYDDSSFSPNWKKIAELNDNLRKTFSGGYVMTSNGIVKEYYQKEFGNISLNEIEEKIAKVVVNPQNENIIAALPNRRAAPVQWCWELSNV